ncbi:protein PFC0760c-like [Ruditapes philippinarum]|uniref:protein PFC0760c-like n=1 Tax=Ruditapes philippinarum TaxID=129788 RepID=UPI00295AEACF|nr:protein PFC0760c-like [Ruditapes philippinarum]
MFRDVQRCVRTQEHTFEWFEQDRTGPSTVYRAPVYQKRFSFIPGHKSTTPMFGDSRYGLPPRSNFNKFVRSQKRATADVFCYSSADTEDTSRVNTQSLVWGTRYCRKYVNQPDPLEAQLLLSLKVVLQIKEIITKDTLKWCNDDLEGAEDATDNASVNNSSNAIDRDDVERIGKGDDKDVNLSDNDSSGDNNRNRDDVEGNDMSDENLSCNDDPVDDNDSDEIERMHYDNNKDDVERHAMSDEIDENLSANDSSGENDRDDIERNSRNDEKDKNLSDNYARDDNDKDYVERNGDSDEKDENLSDNDESDDNDRDDEERHDMSDENDENLSGNNDRDEECRWK